MKSNAIDPDAGTVTVSVSPTTIFEALSHERRQLALQYLVHKPGAVELGDIAEYIAIEEERTTQDQYERIITGLYHNQLPRLIGTDLVQYDGDRETVSLRVDREALQPYLDLAYR